MKVMVSSTARDLPEHRQQVLDACLRQGMFPTMMEHLPASDADAIQASLKMVDEADLYLGVFAFRYGYVPAGHDICITEMEYNRAVERNIPRLVFLMHEDHPIKPRDMETGAGAEKLEKFKARLAKERVVNFFKSPDDLGKQVINSLSQYRTWGAAVPRALHRLPPPPPDFTGREKELAELRTAIEQGGATISGLQGQGGVGKTALALKLAQELGAKFPDAQIYMDLRGVSEKPLTAVEAMAYVVRAFDPEGSKLPESVNELKLIYLSALAGKRALLVMDNARDAAQVAPLVPPPGSALIVTSRFHFAIPGLRAKNLDTLPPADAKALLLSIAPRIDGAAETFAKVCGYLPLALRLAATALAERIDLDPASYARRLASEKDRLKLLKESATDPGVEASIGLSYGLLDPESQKRWRTLAVFPDTFDVPAAAAIWKMESDAAQEALSRLVQYSMLEWNQATKRYRLHDLMRDFAESRLGHDERKTATQNHAGYYLTVLRETGRLYQLGGESLKSGLALFDVEWGNIQAGQAWAANHAGQDNEADRLCSGYPDAGAYCLDLRQHPRESIRWREAALAAARRLKERGAEGAHLGNLGNRHRELGEPRQAVQYYEQELAIVREVGDKGGEGSALRGLGLAYADLGETERAIKYHEQALAIDRATGDRLREGADLNNLGLAYAALGEPRRAIEYYEQGLAIDRDIGERRSEGHVLGNLGSAYYNLGEPRRAIEYYEQDLAITRDISDRRGQGYALWGFGVAYAALGEPRRAIEYYEQHLTIAREIGDRRGEGNALWCISLALDKLGERPKAVERAEAALNIFEQIEDPYAGKVRSQLEQWKR